MIVCKYICINSVSCRSGRDIGILDCSVSYSGVVRCDFNGICVVLGISE